MILRRLAFTIFKGAYRLLYGTGVSRLPLVRKAGDLLVSSFGGDCLTVDGRKLYFGRSAGLLRHQLLVFGIYEPGTTALFKRVVRPGMTVVDIGAHIGYFTVLAAELVGNSGRVYAFEPDPSSFALLVKNIKANDYTNVIPVRKGVANYTGTASLFFDARDTGLNTMYRPDPAQESGAVAIEVTTLDDFFSNVKGPIDLIKMDIEGGEMAALEGMAKTIASNPSLKVITEFFPPWLERAGVSPAEFLNRLSGYGFTRYLIGDSTAGLEQVEVAALMESSRGEGTNLFLERE